MLCLTTAVEADDVAEKNERMMCCTGCVAEVDVGCGCGGKRMFWFETPGGGGSRTPNVVVVVGRRIVVWTFRRTEFRTLPRFL